MKTIARSPGQNNLSGRSPNQLDSRKKVFLEDIEEPVLGHEHVGRQECMQVYRLLLYCRVSCIIKSIIIWLLLLYFCFISLGFGVRGGGLLRPRDHKVVDWTGKFRDTDMLCADLQGFSLGL